MEGVENERVVGKVQGKLDGRARFLTGWCCSGGRGMERGDHWEKRETFFIGRTKVKAECGGLRGWLPDSFCPQRFPAQPQAINLCE
jgi:hypothetical protein